MNKRLITLLLENGKSIVGIWMNDHRPDERFFQIKNPLYVTKVKHEGQFVTGFDTVLPIQDSEDFIIYKDKLMGYTFTGQALGNQYAQAFKKMTEINKSTNNSFMPPNPWRSGNNSEET